MNNIKQIRLSKNNFTIDLDSTSLKLAYKRQPDRFVVDISMMNLINATKIAILCSTYCFIKNFKKKICWIVADEEIKRAISILRLRNVEQEILNIEKESKFLVS